VPVKQAGRKGGRSTAASTLLVCENLSLILDRKSGIADDDESKSATIDI
jgi:hypothetical protein